MENAILSTFAAALVSGAIFVIIARQLRVSAIVVLLLGGIVVGPEGIGLVNPDNLGNGLRPIVALAVGLILFEGGLTLETEGYRQASQVIRAILTRGVLITWSLTAVAVHFIFGLDWGFSALAGSLVIVTGPTVIAPLLKRIRVSRQLHSILHWEGVLIDPIGVFIALLCYEWTVSGHERAIALFALRIITGIAVGGLSGVLVATVIRADWIPKSSLNTFVVSVAMGIFAVSDILAHESGLLSVTIAGFVAGYMAHNEMEPVRRYKAELIELLIGLLFVLLAANLELDTFREWGWGLVAVVVTIMFIVRPVNILVSTHGSALTFREKLFLSWVAPRGIVAASMASLFALTLSDAGQPNAPFLEAFTYSVIAGTVVFQGFTAGWVGKQLGVLEPRATGWLIVGAHQLAHVIARFIRDNGGSAVLLDTNVRSVARARRAGLEALCVDAMVVRPETYPQLYGIGNVLAITENRNLNTLLCQRWQRELPNANLYRWGYAEANQNEHDSLAVGDVVWEDLQLEAAVDHNLSEQEIGAFTSQTAGEQLHHPERVLLACSDNGDIVPNAPQANDGQYALLMYHPFTVRLNVHMRPEWVIVSSATDLDALFSELLCRVKQTYPLLDVDDLRQRLLAQEREYTSLVGYGIALPHTYTDALEESIVLVAKLHQQIPCQHSGDDIAAAFLVLTPRGKPQSHLKALSEISKFIMDDENRRLLLQATTDSDMQELLFPENAARPEPA